MKKVTKARIAILDNGDADISEGTVSAEVFKMRSLGIAFIGRRGQRTPREVRSQTQIRTSRKGCEVGNGSNEPSVRCLCTQPIPQLCQSILSQSAGFANPLVPRLIHRGWNMEKFQLVLNI